MSIDLLDSQVKATGTTGSSTITKPAGTASGTLLVAFHTADTPTLAQMSISGGSTWNSGASFATTSSSYASYTEAWWKFAGGSEPTSYTIAQNSGADGIAIVLAFSGADPDATPVFNTAGANASGTTISTPSVNAESADGVEIRYAGGRTTAARTWSFASVSPTLNPTLDVQSGTYVAGRAAWRQLTASGATGTVTATVSGSTPIRQAVTVAIKAAATAAGFTGWGVPL